MVRGLFRRRFRRPRISTRFCISRISALFFAPLMTHLCIVRSEQWQLRMAKKAHGTKPKILSEKE
jgi:hypothetical protein